MNMKIVVLSFGLFIVYHVNASDTDKKSSSYFDSDPGMNAKEIAESLFKNPSEATLSTLRDVNFFKDEEQFEAVREEIAQMRGAREGELTSENVSKGNGDDAINLRAIIVETYGECDQQEDRF